MPHRYQSVSEKIEMYLALIVNAYKRMATNRDPVYRQTQLAYTAEWLEQLTLLYEAGAMVF